MSFLSDRKEARRRLEEARSVPRPLIGHARSPWLGRGPPCPDCGGRMALLYYDKMRDTDYWACEGDCFP